MPNRRAVLFMVIGVLIPLASPCEELRPASVIEREIAGTKTDVYELPLAAGQCASLAVDQKGIDVVVSILDAAGKTLTETDDESRTTGQETTIVVADGASVYRVSIKPRYSRAPSGNYAVTLVEKRPATDADRSLFQAASLITQAASLLTAGKIEQARTTSDHAVELAEKVLGANDPYVGQLVLRSGHAERLLSQYARAREKYERAEAIFEAAYGRDDIRTAAALDWMGLAYLYENDYPKAEAFLNEALAITEHVLGPDHPRVVLSLQHLAVAYQDLGDKQGAVSTLERALRICEKSVDPDDFQVTSIVGNLGIIYRELHDYDHAEPMLTRALHMVEKKFGVDHPYVAIPLQELGIIARDRKDFETAQAVLWRAEAAREKALGLRNPLTIASLIVIANTYDAEGERARGLALHHRIHELLETVVGPYSNLMLITLANLATGYAAVGDAACAIEYEARMDAVLEKNLELNLAIGSERQKLAYADSVSGKRTDRTITLHVVYAPDDPAAAEHALLVLLQRKGRVLDALSQNLTKVRQGLDPDDQKLLDRLRTTTAELAKVALNGPGKTPLATYRAGLAKLESEKENLEATISARSAAFRADHRAVTVEAVRDSIPADAALVELSVYHPYHPAATNDADEYGEPRYVAYVLRRHGKVLWKDLGPAKPIDDTVAKWRKALGDPERSDVDELARAADRAIMQPLRELAGNARRLLISPDGQLDLIPFEALVDARGRYLVERYSISYLSSGRDLMRMSISRASRTPPVVVADPFFGQPEGSQPVKIASAIAQRRSITSGEDLSTVYFGPLAGTREEARSIHALFPDARVLTGKKATKAALQHVDAPEILHIATHGFFLQTSGRAEPMTSGTRSVTATVTTPNPLLRSGLALSGANLSSHGNDDGVLTAQEASTLNLWGTKLVTLSACDSGVGEVRNREGVYGLRRAFFLAGAETVVMSLWPVSDYVTRQMMTAYYTGLKHGLGRGEALRQAELAMLHKNHRSHPFYWASFIQSGDWRGLNN